MNVFDHILSTLLFKAWCAFALICLILPFAAHGQGNSKQIPLTIDLERSQGAKIAQDQNGSYEIRATDPKVSVLLRLPSEVPADQLSILAFEYLSYNPSRTAGVTFGQSAAQSHTVAADAIGHSEAFTPYAFSLSGSSDWKGMIGYLRLNIDANAGDVFNIRSIALRAAPTTGGAPRAESRVQLHAEDEQLRAEIAAYLTRTYPATITSIAVGKTAIRISGQTKGDETSLYLAEIPLDQNLPRLHSFILAGQVTPEAHHFEMQVPRMRGLRDLELSRWAVVHKTPAGYELASHAHYPDEVVSEGDYPEEKPRCKKGLTSFSASPKNPLADIDDLGICSVTAPLSIGFFRVTGRPGDIAFTWEGQTYYADSATIERLDQTMLLAASHHIIVSTPLLVPQAKNWSDPAMGKLLAYPEADPSARYAMPNVATPDGLRAYAAILNFLAERYSRPDEKYGRIQHWIMHNEVDTPGWTSAGDKTRLTYMNLYLKSMRMMYLITKKYNPNSSVFISLTHYWTHTIDPRFYLPKEMLEDLDIFSKVEGDFYWGVAYHPYPEHLPNPRTWEDNEVTYSLDTPLITPKNIEVLNAWAHQPVNLYQGKVRPIFLTEQGFNAPGNTEAGMTDQAAGMAYTWKKIEVLDAIQAFNYHSWMDSKSERALFGLRKGETDPDPLGKKTIWDVYRQLGTTAEEKAIAPYLRVIGISDWTHVPYRGPIQGAVNVDAPAAK